MITVDETYFEEEECDDDGEAAKYYESLVEEMCGPCYNDGYTIRRN